METTNYTNYTNYSLDECWHYIRQVHARYPRELLTALQMFADQAEKGRAEFDDLRQTLDEMLANRPVQRASASMLVNKLRELI